MDEYIERAAAIKSVLRMRRPENSVAQNRMLSIIQMDMLKLPAADVAPVVYGRWIKDDFLSDDVNNAEKCSQCGELIGWFGNLPNYCPNCGAKMDGGDGDAKSM